ncbi:Methyltransferase domain-containing protein [Flavobacterium fryxellicola]|uniref:Methyltransferase type 11 domain-containing protein n=1 Tax=Flavobacterium fryxellicola TaxID=249352 RepID=A0A167WZ28_9FLAO|nr:methyltransferase domain-containing protein [Flavobacterium fryxellicola]OAB27873.1 hypothetical protein FBFR_08380 [Flavobacterium fryxellicola]SHN66070.1 Methyltransferase domain-containing protein [Flavobacterium fryxellicola]
MVNQFTDLRLSTHILESYVIRNEIFEAISVVKHSFRGKVLDSGCGIMPYKKVILENKEITSYVALDIESGLSYDDVGPDFCWNGLTMPFENDTFEVVLSTEVLEHVLNPDIYLLDVKRVLKPGGGFFKAIFNVIT